MSGHRSKLTQNAEHVGHRKYGNKENDHVEYIEYCFKDMERPKFGWRASMLQERCARQVASILPTFADYV